jgi:hypothetical protein
MLVSPTAPSSLWASIVTTIIKQERPPRVLTDPVSRSDRVNTLYADSCIMPVFFAEQVLFVERVHLTREPVTIVEILFLLPTGLLTFFLPGYAVWSRLGRDGMEPPRLQTALAIATVSVLISGILGMLLAQVGVFSLATWSATVLAFSAVLLSDNFRRRKFPWPFKVSKDRRSLLLFAILAIFAAQVYRPFEWVVGGRDPGVYFNTAAQIAINGSILVHDKLMAALPEASFGSLYYAVKPNCQSALYGMQHWGFYLYDAQKGLVVPQFLHLFPLLMSIFYAAGGPTAALFLTPLLSLISIATVYAIVRAISGWKAGIATGLLLVFNFAQIYFSRGPYPEILMQLLIFAAILAIIQMLSGHGVRFYGVVFALAVGALTITKEEGWVTAFLLAGFAAYTVGRPLMTRRFAASICLLLALGLYSAVSSFVFWRRYLDDTIRGIVYGRISPCQLPISTFGMVAAGLGLVIPAGLLLGVLLSHVNLGRVLSNRRARIRRMHTMFALGLLVSLIGLLLYTYYVRPSGDITNNSWNLVKIGWYVGNFPGLAGGLLGIVLLAVKDFRRNKFLLAVFLAYSLFLANALIFPDQPWWARRFIAGIIPLIAIGLGEFTRAISNLNFRHVKIGRPLAVAFFLVVIVLTAQHLPLIENYVEYRGALQQTELLALRFPADSVILYPANDGYAEWVVVPLRYMHGLNPVPFQRFDQNVINAVSNWLAEGLHVYLLHVPNNQTSQFGKYFVVEKITTVTLSYELLTGRYGFFPSRAAIVKIDYPIVELKLP